MEKNRINTDFLKRTTYNEMTDQAKESVSWIKICVCLLLYGIAIFLQIRLISAGTNMGGMIAQVQVMISVYLVVAIKQKGYLMAIALNTLVFLITATAVFVNGNMNVLPGLVLPLGTIITLSIILFYVRGFDSKLTEVSKQKEELRILYEELAKSENEIRKQNIQLKEFNNQIKEREAKHHYLSYTDVLTEIPNRKMILKRLDLLFDLSHDNQMYFAVVIMDLDHFKRINKSVGYYIGDLLLKEIVSRIQHLIYKQDMLGRLGSDEFALIIEQNLSDKEIFDYVESLRIALLKSFIIENVEVNVSGSFGISLFPQDGLTSTELLTFADIALHKSKESGINGVQFFNRDMLEQES